MSKVELKHYLRALAGVLILAAFTIAAFVFTRGERDIYFPESFRNHGRTTALLLQEAISQKRLVLPAYVATNGLTSSTALWRHLAQDQLLGLDLARFAVPGGPNYGGGDPAAFAAAQNAWSIFSGMTTGTPPAAPFIFTRNVQFTNEDGVIRAQLHTQTAFGTGAGLVIDGAGKIFTIKPGQPDARTWQLRPADLDRVLEP